MLFNNEPITPLLNLTSIQGKDLDKYNLLKYRMICAVLDFIAIGKNVDYYPNKENIRNMLIVNKIFTETTVGKARANAAFAEMCLMGIIVEDGDNICITKLGIEAYRNNTYHQICASLTSAHESHKVGIMTLWFSILAFIVALCSLVVTLYK